MPKKEKIASILSDKEALYPSILKVGDRYYSSMVVPGLNHEHRLVSPVDINKQTKEVMIKITNLLEECGLSLDDVYKMEIKIGLPLEPLVLVDKICSEFFYEVGIKPVCGISTVSALPYHALIAISFEAVKQCDENGFQKHPSG